MSIPNKTEACPKGDDSLNQHIPWLRRLTRSLVLDQSRADDVLQQVFLLAISKKPSRDRDLKPWLASVARKVAFNQRRAEIRRVKQETGASREQIVTVEYSPGNQKEISQILNQQISELGEPYRTSVQLHFLEGLSVAEVAQRTNVLKSTAQTRIRRGVLQLRAQMDKQFGDRLAWSLMLLPILEPSDASAGAGENALGESGSGSMTAKLQALMGGKAAAAAAVFVLIAVPATIALVDFGVHPQEPLQPFEVTAQAPIPAASPIEQMQDNSEEDSALFESPEAVEEDGSEESSLGMNADPEANGSAQAPAKKGPKGGGKGSREKQFTSYKGGKFVEHSKKSKKK